MINLNGKGVMIVGATGTFGRAMARHLLTYQRPDRLVIYSRGEHAQAAMAAELDQLDREAGRPLRFFIGDVRDVDRLSMAMRGVSYVFHAAAIKRVEVAEYNPQEAVATNVMGSYNVVRAALANNVQRVLAISTDKAAAPTTLYGYTKGCMERIFSAANVLSGSGYDATRFSAVRYGNVLGSAGSVLPIFLDLAMAGKPLPVTDLGMTRFFWPIEGAVEFALEAMGDMVDGEIFVPKMRSMSLSQLIDGLASAIGIGEIAMQRRDPHPAEKQHETLITADEATMTYDLGRSLSIASPSWQGVLPAKYNAIGWSCYEGGAYRSDVADYRMGDGEAANMVLRVVEVLRNGGRYAQE